MWIGEFGRNSKEFLQEKILRNLRQISRDSVFHSIPPKIRKIGEHYLRIFGEVLRNFSIKNSREIQRNFSKLCLLFNSQKKSVKLVNKTWEFLRNFRRNLLEKFSGVSPLKNSREILRNFLRLCLWFSSPKKL